MADNPNANVSLVEQAASGSANGGYLVVMGCVEKNADLTPRVYASLKALMAQHGYAQGVSLGGSFIDETRKPLIFVALPTVTQGAVGRQNSTGVLGTSAVSVSAGPAGVLEETDGIFVVTKAGTVGTNGIAGLLSLDGGRTYRPVRLGTASSYTIPYVGLVLNFGAGTLLVGDKYTWTSSAPVGDATGVQAARIALANQKKPVRSILVIGDAQNVSDAQGVLDQVNLYESANRRFVLARVQLRDRLPLAQMSQVTKRMSAMGTLTFAATGFTVTRTVGSWLTDGVAIGDLVTFGGTTSNNGVKGPVTAVTATVLTFGAGIVNEGPIGTATCTASEGLVFAATTATRSSGSWLADGFRVGDTYTVAGSASNNGSKVITTLSATVLGYASGGVAETVRADAVTITKGETKAAWVASLDAAFQSIDGPSARRIDLGVGRGRKACSVTGWRFRRPVQWAATLREYTHDVHVATWRKIDGPLVGWDLEDPDGNVTEYDERNDGGALAGRFTCFRTWGNGPDGAFIAQSLTRAGDGALLSLTHNMHVANVACTVVQAETENAIGRTLELKADGTAAEFELARIEQRVNSALQRNLLVEKVPGEGKRASYAVWKANRTDPLNVPDAAITGFVDLRIGGTIVRVDTVVKVATG